MAELERVRVRISVGSREPINRTTSMLPREIKAVLGMVDKHMDGCSMRRGKELAKLESRASVLRAEMNKREPVGGDDA